MIKAILAIDANGGIGLDNHLPWPNIPLDLQNFQKLTTNHHVIMGRKTWESLPEKYRPLPNRMNYVVTRSQRDDVVCIHPTEVIDFVSNLDKTSTKDIWVIGGANLINHMIDEIKEFHLTRIQASYTADTYIDIDNMLKTFDKIYEKQHEGLLDATIGFEIWRTKPHQ